MKTKRLEGMVDVSEKEETKRIAVAQAEVKLNKKIIDLIKAKKILKGDVFENARVAGVMAAKKTPELIPLCHPLRISDVKISFAVVNNSVKITSSVSALERTGVEMEALAAAVVSALTVYDMCKYIDKGISICEVKLIKKSGGKSGVYERKD